MGESYPLLTIDVAKLRQNVRRTLDLGRQHGVDFCFVTKCFRSNPELLREMARAGARAFGDTRVENLQRMEGIAEERWCLRIVPPSEAAAIVRHSEVSLNSSWTALEALHAAAREQGRRHEVILMLELGDLREGFMAEDLLAVLRRMRTELPHLVCRGLGANFNCLHGVIPEAGVLQRLLDLGAAWRAESGQVLPCYSGGNSGSMYLLTEGRLPAGINNLRVGEFYLYGHDCSYFRPVEGMARDLFILEAEVIESGVKPSLPEGPQGLDAYARRLNVENYGDIRRILLAVGGQDLGPRPLEALDTQLRYVAASGDHALFDVSASERSFQVGDIVQLKLAYSSLNYAFLTPYVRIRLQDGRDCRWLEEK